METFGEIIKRRRLEKGLSLRAFCLEHQEDPGNWSRMERGILPPPIDLSRLYQIAGFLGWGENSPEFENMVIVAHAERGRVPPAIMNDQHLVRLLPVVFRTITKETPTEEQLLHLADRIREANTPK